MNKYSNYISSILLGVFMKIFDDFIDLKITGFNLLLDISKIVMIITTYFLIDEYYILSIIIFISLITSYYCKGFDNTFWHAYMYFVGFLCLAYYNKIGTLVDYTQPFQILCLIFMPISIYFDEVMYTEEKSRRKTISRLLFIIGITFMILFLEYYDFVKDFRLEFVIYLLIFCNGYFVTNIIIQLFHSKYYEKLETKNEETKNEETKNEETKNEETKNEETKNEETKNEETKNEETKNEKKPSKL
jgi:hypothetical protein